MGLVSILHTSACFEDASPVADGGTASDTSGECVDGTEGCPCIDGQCVGALACLSNVCVDTGATGPDPTGADSGSTGSNSTSSNSTTNAMDTIGPDVDVGPDTLPPMSTGMEELGPGDPCDPIYVFCERDLACVGYGPEGFICEPAGGGAPGEPCFEPQECGYYTACVPAEAFDNNCPEGFGCCTPVCDLFDPEGGNGACNDGQFCDPYFNDQNMPLPGYEHVGVCVNIPGVGGF